MEYLENNLEESERLIKISILLFIIAIILISLGISFGIFRYSRVGSDNIIQIGNIEFAMLDGETINIIDQFPKSDSDGNLNAPYRFTVINNSSDGLSLYYNLILLTDNNENDKNYFTNNQIKFNLKKNYNYIEGTSENNGIKLSNIDGFNLNSTSGSGIVLKNQKIDSKTTDTYELRTWISDDVSYNGEIDEDGLSVGKYNDYTYSLKVQINVSDREM